MPDPSSRPPADYAPPRPAPPRSPDGEDGDGRTVYDSNPLGKDPLVAAVLVGIEGKLAGRVFRIFEGDTVLGRASTLREPFPDGNEWDKKISREHAKIISSQGNFLIQPLKPDQNPTFVDGELVPGEGVFLQDKSRIQMGRSTFVFLAVPTQGNVG